MLRRASRGLAGTYKRLGARRRISRVRFAPEELYVEGGYLMFMDENQSVVSWGIAPGDLRRRDPEIWQLNNATNEWFSEEKPLVPLLRSMFDWYGEIGVWK